MRNQIFDRQSLGRLYFSMLLMFGLLFSALAGWIFDQSTATLNFYIFLVGNFAFAKLGLFRKDFDADVKKSERDIHASPCMDLETISILASRDDASTYIQILAQMVKNPNQVTVVRKSVLNAMRSAMHDHVHFAGDIGKSTLPSLGMAGTVYGLMNAMVTVGYGVAQADDASGMTDAILPVISSLGTAFSTTLTSLLIGTLMIANQAKDLHWAVDRYLDQVDAQLAVYSFPTEKGSDQQ